MLVRNDTQQTGNICRLVSLQRLTRSAIRCMKLGLAVFSRLETPPAVLEIIWLCVGLGTPFVSHVDESRLIYSFQLY